MFVLSNCNGMLYYKARIIFCDKYLLPHDARVCNRHLSFEQQGASTTYARNTEAQA